MPMNWALPLGRGHSHAYEEHCAFHVSVGMLSLKLNSRTLLSLTSIVSCSGNGGFRVLRLSIIA